MSNEDSPSDWSGIQIEFWYRLTDGSCYFVDGVIERAEFDSLILKGDNRIYYVSQMLPDTIIVG